MSGAGKSRVSKERERRFGKRPRAIRRPLPVILIVSDDARTAPAYFNALKQDFKQKLTIAIVPAPHDGASIPAIVGHAQQQRRALRKGRGGRATDAVWALIDTEGDPAQQAEAFEAQRAVQGGVKVAVSIPCYELWTLLHLEDTGAYFLNCGKVLERVEALWKARFNQEFGPKAQADYAKILPFRQQARERAAAHWEHGDQSRTEVFKVIQSIEDAARADAGHRVAPSRKVSRKEDR